MQQQQQAITPDETQLIAKLINFWFNSNVTSTQKHAKATMYTTLWDELWFGGLKNKSIDDLIRSQYEHHVELALAGGYNHWQQSANGSLALIILVDQFTRNIYRNQPKSFAGDELARAVCKHGLEQGYDTELIPACNLFFYIPLLHSENLQDQELSVKLYTALAEKNSKKVPIIFDRFKLLAEEKKKNIEEFGRFPKRVSFFVLFVFYASHFVTTLYLVY